MTGGQAILRVSASALPSHRTHPPPSGGPPHPPRPRRAAGLQPTRAGPALSSRRLSLSGAGKVVHELRAPFRDGTTHFVFEPLVFIERLAALVPPPRMHQLTYHGVLAPGSSRRSEIVPSSAREGRSSCAGEGTRVQPCHRYSEDKRF